MSKEAARGAAGCLLCLLIALTVPMAPVEALTARAVTAPGPVMCDGPHDLIVEKGPLTLQGTQSYDRVCVQNGGTLVASGALTLRAGVLYVAPSGAIAADGATGHDFATHDCIGNDVLTDGAPGGALTIVVRHAIIQGRIAANGGGGLDYGPYCDGVMSIGKGGAAGSVTLTALDVTFPLTGRVTAQGGAGGNASAQPNFGLAPSSAKSGDGGVGGHVILALAHPDSTLLRSHLDVSGGNAGAPGSGPTGTAGVTGTVLIRALTAVEHASIPAEPAALIAIVGAAPVRQSLDPTFAQAPEMRCGLGDLIVRQGTAPVLSGVHQYVHVCVESGGALIGRGSLTLIAQTIAVAPGGRITVDGASPMPFHWSDSGQYASRGACVATHLPPHAGVPGAAGALDNTSNPNMTANPGDGGGLLTVIARSMALDGHISADGGAGQDGPPDPNSGRYGSFAFGGGGGGSGGGVLVVAHKLQLGGEVTVAGGHGGRGNGFDAQGTPAAAGHIGGAGCIKIFTDVLHATAGPLPLVGPAIIGQLLPSDPVGPSASLTNSRYFPQTRHILSGSFLDFWQREGDVAILGYPQTEPFHEGGRLVQYTDRFRLELMADGVRIAPLGRMLTAQRRFARAASVASTPFHLYFPTTGHTLSGPFLDYWRAHDGAALLGAPISEVLYEGNDDGTGRRYRLQWFERGRLEYHPDLAGTRDAVTLGLLGIQALQQRGWLVPFAPHAGGPSLDAGGSPATHLYVVAGGETTFSSDGSRQWHFLWSGPPVQNTLYGNSSAIVRLATADAGRTVYAATSGGGMWQSHDWGHSWQEADQGLPGNNLSVFGIAVAPDQRTVYAAGDGGVYETTDAGATWNLIRARTESDNATQCIVLDPHQSRHLWIGTYGNGLYRSMDAGQHWVHVQGQGFPTSAQVQAIAVSPASSAVVYVSTYEGLYHTGDGGAHWTVVNGPWTGNGSSYGITIDPLQPLHIYVGDNAGVYVSRDGGASWVTGEGLSQGGYPVLVSRDHPGLAYLTNGQIYRTTDGGLTWQPWNGGDIPHDDIVYNLAGDVP